MKIKVLFVLPTLTAGGAERILSFLAHNINPDLFECQLLIIGRETDAAYAHDKNLTSFLNKDRVLKGIYDYAKFVWKFQPHIILSSIGHLNTITGLLSYLFPRTKVLVREASVISSMGRVSDSKTNYSFLSRLAYNRVTGVICQSKDMAEDFKRIYHVSENKVFTINNPITQPANLKPVLDPKSDIQKLITVGRLSREKGHERILDNFAHLEGDFKYTILGDRP